MKKIYLMLLLLAVPVSAQNLAIKKGKKAGVTFEDCSTLVFNDTDEPAAIVINGTLGQKGAADIPIAAGQQMTITQVKVTLSSALVPEYVHLRFYASRPSIPTDPGVPVQEVPGDVLLDVTDCTIASFEVINYDEDHQLYLRNITLNLASPIVLDGNLVNERYWMGVISDARAWACTTNWDTGEDVVGLPLASGDAEFEWFHYLNLEFAYELTADCEMLGLDTYAQKQIAVYPNPAQEIISIANLPQSVLKAAIYSVTGQKVKDIYNNFNQISISDLNSGIYMIRVYGADSVLTAKFNKS